MNVTELARKLKINSKELLEILPEVGFDIGKRAIKVDDVMAKKIITQWPDLIKEYKDRRQEDEKSQQAIIEESKKIVKIPSYITVKDFAGQAELPITKVMAELMKNGVLSSINEKIDYDTAAIIGTDLGIEVLPMEEQDKDSDKIEDAENILLDSDMSKVVFRPPVIVVLGHVDHGKTKLLDTIRKTNVIGGESGGITQHIGAYQIEKKGRLLTFLDTPGHEAFSTMRSRGAKVADIAILMVAADDGIKPQTLESIRIIKSANIPMLVAINKIDKPEANIEKVKKELAQNNLTPEDWGGNIITQPISAKKGDGIDELLETLILLADLNKEKISANPDKKAIGTIIESHIDKGEGPVATVLVHGGTLKKGDMVTISGSYYGKIRALKDFKNTFVKDAGPSMPVRIIGIKAVPSVGDILKVVDKVGKKDKQSDYKLKNQAASVYASQPRKNKEENIVYINIILKADVLGSLEAIIGLLDKLQNPEVKICIVGKGLGSVSESDVLTAESASAVILGFHVISTTAAKNIAQEKKVEIKLHKVIYNLVDDIKERIEKCLKPEIIRNDIGRMKVLAVFRREQNSMIVGGQITKGKALAGAKVDVLRDGKILTTGKLTQLQLNKEEAKQANVGQECGIKVEGKPIIEAGDFLEIYQEDIIKRKVNIC